MHHLYSEQATEGLPKKFAPYMQAYLFLFRHPKFALVLESNDKSEMKRKGCKPKTVSNHSNMSTQEMSRKQPSYASVNSQRPVGRDSAKKAKATDFIVDKVTEGVAKAIVPDTTRVDSLSSIKNIKEA